MSDPKLTRINKYLSEQGFCSRRAADKLIEQRRVTINGRISENGHKGSARRQGLRRRQAGSRRDRVRACLPGLQQTRGGCVHDRYTCGKG